MVPPRWRPQVKTLALIAAAETVIEDAASAGGKGSGSKQELRLTCNLGPPGIGLLIRATSL